MRLDFQKHSLFAGSPVRILFLTSVLLRHLIDVILSYASSDLFDDTASDHHELVRIPLLCDGKSDLGILFDVPVFHATYRRIDEHVVTVGIDPSRCDLRGAIRVYCSKENEVLPFQDFPRMII